MAQSKTSGCYWCVIDCNSCCVPMSQLLSIELAWQFQAFASLLHESHFVIAFQVDHLHSAANIGHRRTHIGVLGLASTLTNLSKYLSPQPEQACELVWFPSRASGYHTRNHWRKLQQRIWCQALLLLCLSLVPSNLEPFRNKNFNHRSNPSPNS